jgi:hypothetical protein
MDKERFERLFGLLKKDVAQRWQTLRRFAKK